MKIIIDSQYNPVGDEYMDERKVEAEVWTTDKYVIVEMEYAKFFFPKELFTGLLSKND
jgi:hypothetical protein